MPSVGLCVRRHGFNWDLLEGDAFAEYDPAYGPELNFAVRLANHGHIVDPGQYVKDLAAHVTDNGGRFVKADVSDIVRKNDRVSGVRAGGETIACDAAVIATGVWSGQLAEKLGVSVPLESERGYHIELWSPKRHATCTGACGRRQVRRDAHGRPPAAGWNCRVWRS